jgi:hypothetical protein
MDEDLESTPLAASSPQGTQQQYTTSPRDAYEEAQRRYEEERFYKEQFTRPVEPTPDEVRRERYVKYGIVLVALATIATILDALSGMAKAR